MTNSHLIGFATFGFMALMALMAWLVSSKHPAVAPKPLLRRRTRRTALFLLVLGAVFGYFAFSIDYRMRITTLHEVMVEGSAYVSPGTPAPLRTVPFTVEHPGVEHELFLSPDSTASQPARADVDLAYSLYGPDGKALLPEKTQRFGYRSGTRGSRPNWNGKTFSFTPAVAGPHMVQVRPLMTGIPRIHVRIVDPQKRDGERMAGY